MNFMDLVSRIRLVEIGWGRKEERGRRKENRFPPRLRFRYRSGRACLFRYHGSLLLPIKFLLSKYRVHILSLSLSRGVVRRYVHGV